MKLNYRLSTVLHVLLHLSESKGPKTSEELGKCLNTNPVVVRRTMGMLREANIVTSARGHSGGWRLGADLSAVSLRQLYEVIGLPPVFAIGNRSETPDCLIEQTVNSALNGAFVEAESILLKCFSSITLDDLANDFSQRLACRKSQQKKEKCSSG